MGKRYKPSVGYTRAEQDAQKKRVKPLAPKPPRQKTIIDKFREYSGGVITEASIQRGLASPSPVWRKRARIVASKMPLKEKKKR